jgi:hypothetical protein
MSGDWGAKAASQCKQGITSCRDKPGSFQLDQYNINKKYKKVRIGGRRDLISFIYCL